jgi:GTP-binding protein
MFVDEVDIEVTAGDGGRGCLSFRREKYVPRGGPDGGNGGHGGSVVLAASAHHNTLVGFRYHREFHAGRGRHGEGSNRTGRNGDNLVLDVPIGTVVLERRPEGLVPLADLTEPGARIVVARGGRGGRGNSAFATPTNRAPRRVEPGEPGESRRLHLRLKLLADVGLVGFPNAGKSTLISRISAARPKIADYPFTTLTPHLGVVTPPGGDRSFIVADVPGLIEGAHAGHGLGDRFLSHLERTKVLVHVIDVSSASGREPVGDLDVLRRELELYTDALEPLEHLADKPQLVAANKIDALDDPGRLSRLAGQVQTIGLPLYPISAVTGEGVPALVEAIWRAVEDARTREREGETPSLID